MSTNDPVSRSIILYMVKSGYIAKSAQAVKPPQNRNFVQKAIDWLIGRNKFVRPRLEKIQTAIDVATPHIQERYAATQRNKLLADIASELKKVGTPDDVINAVTGRAGEAFDAVMASGQGNPVAAAAAAKFTAQATYDGKRLAAAAEPRVGRAAAAAVSDWHTHALDLTKIPVETDVAGVVTPHLQNVLAALQRSGTPTDAAIHQAVEKELMKRAPMTETTQQAFSPELEKAIWGGRPTGYATTEAGKKLLTGASIIGGVYGGYRLLAPGEAGVPFDTEQSPKLEGLRRLYSGMPASREQTAPNENVPSATPTERIPATEQLKRSGQLKANEIDIY